MAHATSSGRNTSLCGAHTPFLFDFGNWMDGAGLREATDVFPRR